MALHAIQQELAQSRADVSWVGKDQLHVTVKFFGEADDRQRSLIQRQLEDQARQQAPFKMSLSALGAFPSLRAPRVIWVGIAEGKEPLTEVAKAIEAGARMQGLRQEDRVFSAHVTIGRVRSSARRADLVARLQALPFPSLPAWPVTSLQLYQSTLSSLGPTYRLLAEVRLAAGEASP
jgi:2'-5' RNA ligase